MLTHRLVAAALVIAAACLSTANAGHRYEKRSACEQSARTLLAACHADVRDDLYTTMASCQHIGDTSERWTCYLEASETRAEGSENCGAVYEARTEACDLLGEDRYDPDPLLDPGNMFVHPDQVGDTYAANPYVSIEAGHTYVIRAGEDEDELVVVHVTDATREILGVPCRVVVDIVLEVEEEDGETEYEAVEATDDWFAQTVDGDVVYCGEVSRNYEDGALRDIDGSFEAGREFAKSGYLVWQAPVPGIAHRQEFLPNEAEDIVQYVSLNSGPAEDEGDDNEMFPCDETGCLRTYEFAPIDPEGSEFKFYRPGLGFVLALGLEDGEFTGEREEVVCVGDSLDVLESDDCGIEDVETVYEELCKLSPEVFCLAGD
jgi:hypothetical protein